MRLNEILDMVFRWAHMIAGIMWIGNSMLFNWLDRNLEKSGQALSRLSQGKIFMVHSGAFYDVEKKLLEPGELPTTLYWFKWQNGITWMTGIGLLVTVYFMESGAGGTLVPRGGIDRSVAITLSVSSLFTGWLIYDGLWRIFGEHNPRVATLLSIAMLFGAIFGFSLVFDGRTMYIQTGVLIGTLMTGNVWLCILPSQRSLIAATKSGAEQDPTLSLRAKQRSIHNNYFTFPLLFIMVSNHFQTAQGHYLNWLILIVVMIGGAGVRHFMNVRYLGEGRQLASKLWVVPALVTGAITVSGVLVISRIQKAPAIVIEGPVKFARAQEIIVKRCMRCHSAHPTDEVYTFPPNNVVFDSPDHIQMMAPRIRERAVLTETMPIGNKTGMTAEERAELGKWIEDGAKLE